MSLAEARIEARKARVQVDKQEDPIRLKRQAMIELMQRRAFRLLCEDWYRGEVLARGVKHPQIARRYLDKCVLPALGSTVAAEITPIDVARLLDELKTRAPTAANDLLRFVRRIFAFGVRRRAVPSNPAAELTPPSRCRRWMPAATSVRAIGH